MTLETEDLLEWRAMMHSRAREYALGTIVDATTKRWKHAKVAYSLMRVEDQEQLLRDVADDVRRALDEVITIIASDDRTTFKAECESVTFKEGVKATIKLGSGPNAHALADCAGGVVLLVLEDGGRYMAIGDATKGDAAQGSLIP
jgi:hypothetical protein